MSELTFHTTMTCAFPGCQRRLNPYRHWIQGEETLSWLHGAPRVGCPDHEPVPVLEEELPAVLCCDFCQGDDASWHIGATGWDEDMGMVDGHATILHTNVDESPEEAAWNACATCRDLVDGGDLRKLAERSWQYTSTHGWMSKMSRDEKRRAKPRLIREIMELHQRFVTHRTYDDYPEAVAVVEADPDGSNRLVNPGS